ncbi:MAG: oxidoreductase [Saprospiraceae bacterium]|nr:oxidoreductase [Saprospiraceae bacterium]
MSAKKTKAPICIIIGASHAGVNCAFALRREGWEGEILLIDTDPHLPYHRPPLSKSFLTEEGGVEKIALRPAASYEKERIERVIGKVSAIDRAKKQVKLTDSRAFTYDKLVVATGARPLIPPIPGLQENKRVFTLRHAEDITQIRKALHNSQAKRVLIIGGGYIGLELAASLAKLEAKVVVLEREQRLLARVTAPALSDFFLDLHQARGVQVCNGKHVIAIHTTADYSQVECADGTIFDTDLIILGVGIIVNTELAEAAGLDIENGIKVDETTCTNDEHIYAIGDCSFHYNSYYDTFVRLESVQNAVDQAKVAAANICCKHTTYQALPWFWSDQYDIKLQTVGLFQGYDEAILREEPDKDNCFSVWYFKGSRLLAVDAVNSAKAYVVGMKLLKERSLVDKAKIADPNSPLKPALLLEG